jgi:hypothetical protein
MDFDAITDWPAYLRDAIARPAAHPELALHPDATTPSAELGLLATVVHGPTLARLIDGALALVDSGDPELARPVLTIPLEQAPGAAARIGRALLAHGARFDDAIVDALLDRALKADARDPDLVAAADALVQRRGPRVVAVMALARPDWAARHVDRISAAADPDGALLLRVLGRTRTPDLPAMVDAIAAAGPDYPARLARALATWPASAQDRVRPALRAHPAFASLVT